MSKIFYALANLLETKKGGEGLTINQAASGDVGFSPAALASTIIDDPDDEKTCPEGKFLNPKTNRCKELQTVVEGTTGKTITTYDPETGEGTTIKVCNDGYVLNAETNRCNKIKDESSGGSSSTDTSSTVKTCPEGKFLNPKTNRCKNLQTVAEGTTGKTVTTFDPETGESTTEKICYDGYELNPETNRCVKNKTENTGAEYELDVPSLGAETKDNFIAIASVIMLITLGLGILVFQFRKEILKLLRRLLPRKKP